MSKLTKEKTSSGSGGAVWDHENGKWRPFTNYTGNPQERMTQAHRWQAKYDTDTSAREDSLKWLAERGLGA